MPTTHKTNLLYVITKMELGGAQKHVLSVLRGINTDKFNVFLFSAKTGILLTEAGAISGLKIQGSSFLERSINPVKDFFAFLELCWFLKRHQIQIVHTHSSKAGILGRLAARVCGVKVIIHTVHGWSFHRRQPWIPRSFYQQLERICARWTSRLIVVSTSDKRIGEQNVLSDQARYALIRCAVDSLAPADDQARVLARQRLGLGGGDLAVGMVGCLKPQKAPLDFVKLARDLKADIPHIQFFLVGDGALRPEVERQIRACGLGEIVTLLGWRQDVNVILSALDVFVLTSLWEGLPLAVVEAMQCGVPVVATDTGGIRDIVSDGDSGYLVPPGDIRMMGERTRQLLADAALRRTFTARARMSVSDGSFSRAEMLRRIEDVYDQEIAEAAGV